MSWEYVNELWLLFVSFIGDWAVPSLIFELESETEEADDSEDGVLDDVDENADVDEDDSGWCGDKRPFWLFPVEVVWYKGDSIGETDVPLVDDGIVHDKFCEFEFICALFTWCKLAWFCIVIDDVEDDVDDGEFSLLFVVPLLPFVVSLDPFVCIWLEFHVFCTWWLL